jgi:hypothetical protein
VYPSLELDEMHALTLVGGENALISVSRRFIDEQFVYWPPWDARRAEVATRGLEGGSELLLVGFQLILVSVAYT